MSGGQGHNAIHPAMAGPERLLRPLSARLWELERSQRFAVLILCLDISALRDVAYAHGRLSSEVSLRMLPNALAGRCGRRDGLSLALQGILDRRYALWIGRFAKQQSGVAALAAWRAALERNEIAGALWGVLTCRVATPALRGLVMEDLRALSMRSTLGPGQRARSSTSPSRDAFA